MTASSVLRFARTSLAEVLNSTVTDICGDCLPLAQHKEVAWAVKSGLLSGCRFLLKNPRSISDDTMRRSLFALPSYWEPPFMHGEPAWPPHQLQAYRWAASILGYSVRNALEDLHARSIPDELMPLLNRAVRNTIFEVIVEIPSLGWRLSKTPRAFLTVNTKHRHMWRFPNPVGNLGQTVERKETT